MGIRVSSQIVILGNSYVIFEIKLKKVFFGNAIQ